MKQQSTVEISGSEIIVTSEVVTDPEYMIMTSVCNRAGALLKKTHMAISSATMADYNHRGDVALRACLSSTHIRVIGTLLSTPAQTEALRGRKLSPGRAGMLASVVFDSSGNMIAQAGHEQIPSSWLKAAFLLSEIQKITGALFQSNVSGIRLESEELFALAVEKSGEFRVMFGNPKTTDLQKAI